MSPVLLLLLVASTPPISWRAVDAQSLLKGIALSIEPSNDVARDTDVTLRCRADVSSSGQEAVNRQYNIYKNTDLVYTKNSSSSEDFLYQLPKARVSNSGKYKCEINIEGKTQTSEIQKLKVTGLATPEFRLNHDVVNEGEELTARCTAPGETGAIIFYIYDDSKEIRESQVNTNYTEVKLRFNSPGIHRIHCAYTVVLIPDAVMSEKSNNVVLSVKELQINMDMEIFPQSKIFEGDRLTISCTVKKPPYSSQSIQLYLTQGAQLLSSEFVKPRVNHSMVALAKDSGEFECRLKMGNVDKFTKKTISVTELFSVPTLTMTPPEVFQKDGMTLTCKSESFANERIRREDLTYRMIPQENHLDHIRSGMFTGKALTSDFNYTCIAEAKGIVKHSKTLTVRPKIDVSTPKILVVDKAIIGRPFMVHCKSDFGSLPINYTLLKDYEELDSITVKQLRQGAHFTITITRPEEIGRYMCEAKNSFKDGKLSKRLNATVIVPLSQPTLTVIPTVSEISEGDHLYLICGVKGSPPVTFKWYRVGNDQPVYTTTSNNNNTDYQVPWLTKGHSGTYYCEGLNYANNIVRSAQVTIEVGLAMWKKVLIVGFCLLALSVLVAVLVVCFRSKRGKREAAAELSVKPSSPKSDDSLTVNLTHDTEVYNAATVRVDRSDSVWSERPPEAAANDEETSMVSNEPPDVEYTEVVHPRAADSTRVPLRKGTDTVYSELQNSPHGAADHYDYGSVEYAELNGEQQVNHCHPEVNNYQDLPEPVD